VRQAAAARINDMHHCPQNDMRPGPRLVHHHGGPITGPGIPTVLIGGYPAAVIGDHCRCDGDQPPDSIVSGSATVLIGGKKAARLADDTAHGGMIVAGCPTVLIGG